MIIAEYSLLVNVLLLMFIVFCYMSFPTSAKILIKKRFGLLKNKMLKVVAYPDKDVCIEAHTVALEGCSESQRANKLTKSYYLPAPMVDTSNVEDNVANAKRDQTMLATFMLDGMPVSFCYATYAVSVNPAVITALGVANKVDHNSPNKLKSKTTLQHIDEVVGKYVEVDVLLPFDPTDIQRHFRKYWSQEMMHSTKIRWENIGKEKNATKEGASMAKIFIIAGVVALIALTVAGLFAGGFIGA